MQKIDLTSLYINDNEFLKDLKRLEKAVKKYKTFEGHIFDSSKSLLEFLEYDKNFSIDFEKCYQYAHINSDLDLKNDKYQNYYGKVMNLYMLYNEITSYVQSEILSKEYSLFEKYLKENPKLKEYKRSVKNLFKNKKLIKSKEEEYLISMLTSTYNRPEEISEMLTNTDLNYGFIKDEEGKEIKLTNSNYSTYLESNNREVRKSAFDKIYEEFKAHENTYATILATEVMNNNKIAKIRNFKSARSLSLYHNDIKNDIYDKLIKGVHKNLDKFYPYYELKQKILNIKEFHLYDTYASITKEFNKKYSYDEAKQLVLKSTEVLGQDYVNTLKRAFDENWIDAGINESKRSGAYCTCVYATNPYVVLSYENKLNDVSTLTHELGHAMHYYYAMTNNSYVDYDYSIFVAEVASQVNEILLTNYIYNNSKDIEEKKYLLDQMLQRFKSTVIRQTMFAEFEDKIHTLENNGIVLTNKELTSNYYDLNKKYFGSNVVIDENIKYECYRIPHFYYNFYVYQYATGYCAALKIANDILSGKKDAKENYLKFLALGKTKDPVSSLKVAGVDINDENLYDDIFNIFESKLNELRGLYE